MKKIIEILCFITLSGATLSAQPSGSVTQGLGATTVANLMPACPSNHVTPLGTITSSDGNVWVVPAENNFQTATKLADLHNTCNGVAPANLAAANLSNVPVIEIDPDGEVITGYLFADNYFELYINGVLLGVDAVPFTPFNSSVVKFRVKTPYTIAVKLVDWEENPGLGSEINNGSNYHPGDGGFIAQFSDGTVTDAQWKAQVFYIAPIENLNDVVEMPDGTHATAGATLTPTCNANCYGVHYPIPDNWTAENFNDSGWTNASLYTAAQVTNQAAYTNFANTAWSNAKFIWTSNLILDNVVLVRKKVGTSAVAETEFARGFHFQNPFSGKITFEASQDLQGASAVLYDGQGRQTGYWPDVSCRAGESAELNLPAPIAQGLYFLKIQDKKGSFSVKLLHTK